MRSLFVSFAVVLALLPGLPGQGAAERAREEALSAFKGDQEYKEAQRRWPEYERIINSEITKQDKLVSAGGKKLDQQIAQYELRAEIEGTPVNHYLAGRILGLAERFEQARLFFERSIKVDPYFYWGHHGMGAYFARREMHEPAAKHYQQALELNPTFAKARFGLALCCIRMRKHLRAEALLQEIIADAPDDVQPRLALAQMYIQTSRHSEAINALLELKQRSTDTANVDRLLAFCYGRVDQLEKATALYGAILQEDPKDWRSAMELAKLLMRDGQNHAAAERFQQALDSLPLGARVDREQMEGLVAELRAGPAKAVKREGVQSPEQWLEILLNSVEPERRRRAALILSASPVRHAELDKGFLRALRDGDSFVRTIAVRTVGRWWGEAEQLDDERLVKIMSLLLDDRSETVRASAAATLGRADHPRAVPPLMGRLEKEDDPYVFHQIHRGLNRLTFAYISVVMEDDLKADDLTALRRDWRAWYDANSSSYRKYEGR